MVLRRPWALLTMLQDFPWMIQAALLCQVDGSTVDHDTYLVKHGTADIFFPTDFQLIERLYRMAADSCTMRVPGAIWQSWSRKDVCASSSQESIRVLFSHSRPFLLGAVVNTQHVANRDFMLSYGDWQMAATKSGFNPLLTDFANTSVFLGSRKPFILK
jgi:hypothetical protein